MTTSTLQLRIRGPVTACEYRTTRAGMPIVEVHLTDTASGQAIHATHAYPDKSPANFIAARSLASSLRGQVAEFDATNPRFRAKRLDCDAAHIALPLQHHQSTRKDLE